jgi:hypothetical protein
MWPALETWVLPAFLGLGLAAATGLRTFLPLLMLAGCVRLGLFGISVNPQVAWLGSTPMLVGLAVATVAELAADKIPIVDHGLSAVGTVTRPLAGALAAGAVFAHADPAVAAIAGLIIGVPTALAFHGVQSGARVASTATTAGLGNPVLSVVEDVGSALLAAVAIVAPVIAVVAVVTLLAFGLWGFGRLRRRRPAGP